MAFNSRTFSFRLSIPEKPLDRIKNFFETYATTILFFILTMISIFFFLYYYKDGLNVAYNDARSHLDISRRVVENLTPGFAQLGSVWLPLPHLLATLTVWNDFMWHSGLAGALQSMISFIATGILIYNFLKALGVGMYGRLTGVIVFVLNLNILYMQSTAMTELLLIATMTAGSYQLLMWHKEGSMLRLVQSAFWIMLSTLIRYDGWFLLVFAMMLIFLSNIRKHGYKVTEGVLVLFTTLGGFGVFLWLFWNLMIFHDPLYFAFGPYSADAQQNQLAAAGVLATKHNLIFSIQTYLYAIVYNAGFFTTLLGTVGMILFWLDNRIRGNLRIAATVLLAPLFFNILALYLGHSVLFVQGLQGNSWFNVRYGLMMVPSLAIFVGYLVHRIPNIRYVLLALVLFVGFFTITNHDAVTIDDAVVGASGKNVSEVSGWLSSHAKNTPGFVLISVASHDAVIFSSGLPMSRFIHEGTGMYWTAATTNPSKWARWIVMRTNDPSDQTFKALEYNAQFHNDYTLERKLPFADVYEIKPQFVKNLHMTPALDR